MKAQRAAAARKTATKYAPRSAWRASMDPSAVRTARAPAGSANDGTAATESRGSLVAAKTSMFAEAASAVPLRSPQTQTSGARHGTSVPTSENAMTTPRSTAATSAHRPSVMVAPMAGYI